MAHEEAKTQLFVADAELAQWIYYQTTSECLVVNHDSERRHSNEDCRP